MCGYLAYVFVCIYFEPICALVCPKKTPDQKNPTVTSASSSKVEFEHAT